MFMDSLPAAIKSLASFLVSRRGPYAQTPEDLQRLSRYAANRKEYDGETLSNLVSEDGTHPPTVNYLKRNIDKVNYFAFGSGYNANHPRFEDHFQLTRTCWGPSPIEKLLRWSQHGAVTGDAYLMVSPKVIGSSVDVPTPETESKPKIASEVIRVVVLPPETVKPTYDPFDADVIVEAEIRVPKNVTQADGTVKVVYEYMRITPQIVETGTVDNDGNALGDFSSVPNPLGMVYVIHTRNYPHGASIYGLDDVDQQAGLNITLNKTLANINDIVQYHAAPLTAVFGAKADRLVKGANRVWSGLPVNAKVEVVGLGANLAGAVEHYKNVKVCLHEISGVPEIAQGSAQAISNTSGVALHTMYMPLIERAEVKQGIYGPAIVKAEILIMRWAFTLGLTSYVDAEGQVKTVKPITTQTDWEDLRVNTEIAFTSPLPKDELISVQVETAKLSAGLSTRRRSLTVLGVKDVEAALAEIDAEAEEKARLALKAAQDAAAVGAKTPSGAAIDSGSGGVQSGAGANQGTNTSESDTQKGRPKGT